MVHFGEFLKTDYFGQTVLPERLSIETFWMIFKHRGARIFTPKKLSFGTYNEMKVEKIW